MSVQGQQLEYHELKRRNRCVLVDSVFRLYVPASAGIDEIKSNWVELLCNDFSFDEFLRLVKDGEYQPAVKMKPCRESQSAGAAVGRIRVVDENLTMHAGQRRKIYARLVNLSSQVMATSADEPLYISYHWYSTERSVYQFDGMRTSLGGVVAPGEELTISVQIEVPAEPGDYLLMLTMVYEGRCWYEDIGMDTEMLPVTVQDFEGRGLSRHAFSILKQLCFESGVLC